MAMTVTLENHIPERRSFYGRAPDAAVAPLSKPSAMGGEYITCLGEAARCLQDGRTLFITKGSLPPHTTTKEHQQRAEANLLVHGEAMVALEMRHIILCKLAEKSNKELVSGNERGKLDRSRRDTSEAIMTFQSDALAGG
jgi:hypothetical protein